MSNSIPENTHTVSFFAKGIKQKKPTKTITIGEFFQLIETGKYAAQIEALRQETDKTKRDELKKELPYITTSGVFSYGSDDKIVSHSGLMQVDIDHLTPQEKETLKELLALDAYFLAVFDSPTNTGLKAIVEIPANVETHSQSFQALEAYILEQYGVQIDKSCKNVSRAMFVSFDKNLHINTEPKMFDALPANQATDYEAVHQKYEDDFCGILIEPTKYGNQHETVFSLCVDWVNRKHSFVEGQKSFFRYCLACLLCEFGVSESEAIAYISQNYASASGEAKDREDVKSAYKKCQAGKRKYVPYEEYVAQKQKEREGTNTEQSEQGNASDKQRKKQYNKVKVYFFDDRGNLTIDCYKLVEVLKKMGFRRYDLEKKDEFTFIHIQDNIVKEAGITNIKDCFFEWLDKNHIPEAGASLETLKNKLYKGINSFFSEGLLSQLGIDRSIKFVKDTKEKAFFYFQNGIVEVTEQDIKLVPYSQMKGHIWVNQILDRDFVLLPEKTAKEGVFARFCELIAKEDYMNFECLQSIMGYILHDFKDNKRKAVNFTDSSLERGNNGRTGKTLLAKALGKLRVYGEINGKNFEVGNKHKYQDLELDTQFMNLNDVKKGFKLEWIYNDITEGLMVEKKNQTPFRINPNIVVCSNLPLELEGGSDKDRIVEFEFSNKFSIDYTPQHHFKHWFFSDWDTQEWANFDNFMLLCVKFYLKVGDMIPPENTNLAKRKLMSFTSPEFVEYIEAQELKTGVEYEKKALLTDFGQAYPDFGDMKMKAFTKWLRLYVESNPILKMEEKQNKTTRQSVFLLKAKEIVKST